jgi:hypothetical protein
MNLSELTGHLSRGDNNHLLIRPHNRYLTSQHPTQGQAKDMIIGALWNQSGYFLSIAGHFIMLIEVRPRDIFE